MIRTALHSLMIGFTLFVFEGCSTVPDPGKVFKYLRMMEAERYNKANYARTEGPFNIKDMLTSSRRIEESGLTITCEAWGDFVFECSDKEYDGFKKKTKKDMEIAMNFEKFRDYFKVDIERRGSQKLVTDEIEVYLIKPEGEPAKGELIQMRFLEETLCGHFMTLKAEEDLLSIVTKGTKEDRGNEYSRRDVYNFKGIPFELKKGTWEINVKGLPKEYRFKYSVK
jgi:hypothetical protein